MKIREKSVKGSKKKKPTGLNGKRINAGIAAMYSWALCKDGCEYANNRKPRVAEDFIDCITDILHYAAYRDMNVEAILRCAGIHSRAEITNASEDICV